MLPTPVSSAPAPSITVNVYADEGGTPRLISTINLITNTPDLPLLSSLLTEANAPQLNVPAARPPTIEDHLRRIKSCWEKHDGEKDLINRVYLTLLDPDIKDLGLENAKLREITLKLAQLPLSASELYEALRSFSQDFPSSVREWFAQSWPTIKTGNTSNWQKLMTLLENTDHLPIKQLALYYLLLSDGQPGCSDKLVNRAVTSSRATPPAAMTHWVDSVMKNAARGEQSMTMWLGTQLSKNQMFSLDEKEVSAFELVKALWKANIKPDFNEVTHALCVARTQVSEERLTLFKAEWDRFIAAYQQLRLIRKPRKSTAATPRIRRPRKPKVRALQPAFIPKKLITGKMVLDFLKDTNGLGLKNWAELMYCLWQVGVDARHSMLYRACKEFSAYQPLAMPPSDSEIDALINNDFASSAVLEQYVAAFARTLEEEFAMDDTPI